MPDKRNYTRFVISGFVELKLEGGSASPIKCYLADLSFVGFSAYLKERIEVNTFLQFNLVAALSPEYPLSGRAKLKYISENKKYGQPILRAGFEFVNIDAGVMVGLLNRIQEKLRQEERKKRASEELDY